MSYLIRMMNGKTRQYDNVIRIRQGKNHLNITFADGSKIRISHDDWVSYGKVYPQG